MNKRILIILVCVCFMFLSGCSSEEVIDDVVEEIKEDIVSDKIEELSYVICNEKTEIVCIDSDVYNIPLKIGYLEPNDVVCVYEINDTDEGTWIRIGLREWILKSDNNISRTSEPEDGKYSFIKIFDNVPTEVIETYDENYYFGSLVPSEVFENIVQQHDNGFTVTHMLSNTTEDSKKFRNSGYNLGVLDCAYAIKTPESIDPADNKINYEYAKKDYTSNININGNKTTLIVLSFPPFYNDNRGFNVEENGSIVFLSRYVESENTGNYYEYITCRINDKGQLETEYSFNSIESVKLTYKYN